MRERGRPSDEALARLADISTFERRSTGRRSSMKSSQRMAASMSS
jgi:hypothetical protein